MINVDKHIQLKEKIVAIAGDMFRLYGIKAVKMDDIANGLKMSKRTVYEVYENKNDLICDVLIRYTENIRNQMMKYASEHDNVMDLLIEYFRIQTISYSQTNPAFFNDIKRYPDVVERINEYHRETNQNSLNFLQKGVKDGYFLDSVNYQLLSLLCHNCLKEARCNPIYDEYGPRDFFRSFICIIIRGFCTTKGIEKLDEFLDSLE